ncbi:MAG: hypothetical protein J2P17_12060 [Mycobacterium sp.]|nr:hypothetical protein [Mycobacterium sp.]
MSNRRQPRPGDYVRLQFGPRVVEGTVTSVRGNYMHVSVQLGGVDDTIDRFVRTDSLVPA